jgi:hypothetical protein
MGLFDSFNQQQRLADVANARLYEQMKQLLEDNVLSTDTLLQRLMETKKLPQLPVDPKTRIAEIDKELDIIRGRIPTPKGYKIDARKAKALMAERAELENGH